VVQFGAETLGGLRDGIPDPPIELTQPLPNYFGRLFRLSMEFHIFVLHVSVSHGVSVVAAGSPVFEGQFACCQ